MEYKAEKVLTRLETSWDGSSAAKNARRKRLFPRLKSETVIS